MTLDGTRGFRTGYFDVSNPSHPLFIWACHLALLSLGISPLSLDAELLSAGEPDVGISGPV
jgi:hypothetical protein